MPQAAKMLHRLMRQHLFKVFSSWTEFVEARVQNRAKAEAAVRQMLHFGKSAAFRGWMDRTQAAALAKQKLSASLLKLMHKVLPEASTPCKGCQVLPALS